MLYPDNKILLGVAPTRRDEPAFSAEVAGPAKKVVLNKLKEMGIDFVDLDGTCGDGILTTLDDVDAAAKYFSEKGVNALFIPSIVFGNEGASALLAKKLGVPVMIWAPVDPVGDGKSGCPQLGTLTIHKALRRLGVPFTFLGSVDVDHPLFEKGMRTFIAAANVVKEFKRAKILQIGPRPESFWSVIENEGELLERFGIQICPVSLPEFFDEYDAAQSDERVKDIAKELADRTTLCVDYSVAEKSAAMMIAMEKLAAQYHATAISIRCWNELQKHLGMFPCAAAGLLSEKGLVVSCEGDVHGAISLLIGQAASMGKVFPTLVDYDNGHAKELNLMRTHHCSASPIPCYQEKPKLGKRADWGGCLCGQYPTSGKMSFLQFAGDNGKYSVLLARGEGADGPARFDGRTFGWHKVEDWPTFEYKLSTGPYVHHGIIISDDILPAVHEALRFIDGLEPDYVFDSDRLEMESFMYKRDTP